jgi:hypothetical protein
MRVMHPNPTRGVEPERQDKGGMETRSEDVWIFWTERRLLMAMAALVVLTVAGMACSVFL